MTTPYKMTSSMHRFPIRDIPYFSRGFSLFFFPPPDRTTSLPLLEERSEERRSIWNGAGALVLPLLFLKKSLVDDECGSAFDRVYTCVGVGEASIYIEQLPRVQLRTKSCATISTNNFYRDNRSEVRRID